MPEYMEIQTRMMALEQREEIHHEDSIVKITRLEVKMNIIAFLAGTSVTIGVLTLAKVFGIG